MGTIEVYEMMQALSFERAQKKQTDVLKEFPVVYNVNEAVFLGSFSWSWARGDYRIISAGTARYPFGIPQTPAELARDYLTVKFPKPLRAHNRQIADWRDNMRKAPLFAEPCLLNNAVYVDLKSAYWSLLSLFGWNTEYSYKRFWGRGWTCQDFPFFDDKLTRNILVSAGLCTPSLMWTGERLVNVDSKNRHANLGLWTAVQDVLHFIAREAVTKYEAVYVHTDGYIMPSVCAWDFSDWVASLGLEVGVKHKGQAVIYGVGAYDIGSHKCAVHQQHSRVGEYSNLIERDHTFMTENLEFFARLKNRDTCETI